MTLMYWLIAAFVFGLVGCGATPEVTKESPTPTVKKTAVPKATPKATPKPSVTVAEPVEEFVYYSSCKEARKAGAAPLTPGDKGWNPDLDRDNDGIACE